MLRMSRRRLSCLSPVSPGGTWEEVSVDQPMDVDSGSCCDSSPLNGFCVGSLSQLIGLFHSHQPIQLSQWTGAQVLSPHFTLDGGAKRGMTQCPFKDRPQSSDGHADTVHLLPAA